MNNISPLGLLLLVFVFGAFSAFADTGIDTSTTGGTERAVVQQVIEGVDIQGNRRLRDEDLLYYIKVRPGDVYDPAALERDLRELLSLNFFDKAATRVLTEDGIRGGVVKQQFIRFLAIFGGVSACFFLFYNVVSLFARSFRQTFCDC